MIDNIIVFMAIFWSSLGVFGFSRLYYLFIIQFPGIINEKDMINEILIERGVSYDKKSHIYSVFVYLTPGLLYFNNGPSYSLGSILVLYLIFCYYYIRFPISDARSSIYDAVFF